MKTNLKKVLLFCLILTSPLIYGNTVLRLGYSYSDLSSNTFSNYKTDVSGSSFQVGLAERVSLIEYGLLYTKGSYSGSLKHDDSNQEFQGTYSRISLDSKIFFNKHLFLQLGYGFTSAKFNMVSSLSEYQKSSIYSLYDLKSEEKSGAFYYGIGLDVFETKTFNIILSLGRNKIDNHKTETSAMIGLKMSFDLGSKNFLSP